MLRGLTSIATRISTGPAAHRGGWAAGAWIIRYPFSGNLMPNWAT